MIQTSAERQANPEECASAGTGLALDLAAVIADDSLTDAEPIPLPWGLLLMNGSKRRARISAAMPGPSPPRRAQEFSDEAGGTVGGLEEKLEGLSEALVSGPLVHG